MSFWYARKCSGTHFLTSIFPIHIKMRFISVGGTLGSGRLFLHHCKYGFHTQFANLVQQIIDVVLSLYL